MSKYASLVFTGMKGQFLLKVIQSLERVIKFIFLRKKIIFQEPSKSLEELKITYQKIFIAGGGSIGLNVAKLLEDTHNIRIIELDRG